MKEFNPFDIKEKWMKFFNSHSQRIEIDKEVALKNNATVGLLDYLREHFSTFSDREKVQAFQLTLHSSRNNQITQRAKYAINIFQSILEGNFDSTSSNNLALFADAFGKALDFNILNAPKLHVPFDYISGKYNLPRETHLRGF